MSRPGSRKILVFCAGTYVAGAELHMLSRMRALKARGHDVRCVASGWTDGDFPARLREASIETYSIKLGWLFLRQPRWTIDSLQNYPHARRDAAEILRDMQPDITVHMSYRSVLAASGLLDPHRTVVQLVDAQDDTLKNRALFKILGMRVGLFFANTEFLRTRYVELGLPPERIRISHSIIEGEGSTAPHRRVGARARLGVVGQVIPSKGHEDLFRATKLLSDWGVSIDVHVYGKGSEEHLAELRRLAGELGIESAVHFHGFVSDRGRIYDEVDIVAVPSRCEEGFGRVTAEPALWGLPVVAPRSGGLPEVVRHGETGLLYEPLSIEGLASAIRRLVESPQLADELGSAARAHVRSRFAPEPVIEAYARDLTEVYGGEPW